jgi:hypothetical protein
MIKVLQGFEIQKLYEETGKRKYKMNLLPDSYFIDKNENYQKLYKETHAPRLTFRKAYWR